jgi:hypothetical protein
MFTTEKGDRDYARNYIILLTGQDRSLSTNGAWAAAERAEDEGIQLYVVGLDIDDTMELNETPSHPLSTFQYLTRELRSNWMSASVLYLRRPILYSPSSILARLTNLRVNLRTFKTSVFLFL